MVTRLERAGIGLDIPAGWEGSISGGDFRLMSDGAVPRAVAHIGSFPLPSGRGTFGSGAVEVMGSGDVFIAIVEYGPESAGTPLFSTEGIPRRVEARQFDRNLLAQAIPGQSGMQHFFTNNGRAFCLYVVLGSHLDRADLVPRVNAVLATLDLA